MGTFVRSVGGKEMTTQDAYHRFRADMIEYITFLYYSMPKSKQYGLVWSNMNNRNSAETFTELVKHHNSLRGGK